MARYYCVQEDSSIARYYIEVSRDDTFNVYEVTFNSDTNNCGDVGTGILPPNKADKEVDMRELPEPVCDAFRETNLTLSGLL